MISGPTRSVPTSISLEDLLDTIRKPAASLPFPKLLAHVNAGLISPLEFEHEFLSIQRVRNCLEHRGGIVRKQDLDDQGTALTLNFPRLKVFYMRGNEEIELARDERVDDGSHGPEVQILGRIVTRSRTYRLGERVMFTANEFSEIAMACSFFATQLASRLPVISAP
jgi:hypothetical protein